MPASARAKLFMTGGSQAVRLPREFRIEGTEALIRREGRRIILEPVEHKWSPGMLKILQGPVEATFPEEIERQTEYEEREEFE